MVLGLQSIPNKVSAVFVFLSPSLTVIISIINKIMRLEIFHLFIVAQLYIFFRFVLLCVDVTILRENVIHLLLQNLLTLSPV